jgi:hypothetical protein
MRNNTGRLIQSVLLSLCAALLATNAWAQDKVTPVEADWEAPASERWTVPIGGGFGKQFKLFGDQYQFYAQIGYNVVRPDDDSATWRGILALTRVFKLKIENDTECCWFPNPV